MKKYIISAMLSAAILIMMIAGGTADGHFTLGLILALTAIAILGGVAVLCRKWASDLDKEVEDD